MDVQRQIVWLMCGFAAALAAFWLLRTPQISEEAETPRHQVTEERRATRSENGPAPVAESADRGGACRRLSAIPRRRRPPVTQSAEEALPTEWVVVFADDAALDRFLAQQLPPGVTLAGMNRQLRAVRLTVAEGPLPEFEGALRSSPNHRVWLPPEPLPPLPGSGQDVTDSYRPFGNRALAWLGASEDNAAWGHGTTIAVLDTGIALHPALAGAEIVHIDLLPEAAAAEGALHGHGTAVASLLAGQTEGIRGAAPAARLLDVRVLDSTGAGDAFTVALGIVEAVDRGADVINLSLGTYADNPVMADAVRYAADRGVVLVAAAGNDGADALAYPARYDGVVSVGAVDADREAAGFSNRSNDLTLSAPGYGLNAAWTDERTVSVSGTSFAAPFVAAAVAEWGLEAVVRHSDDAGQPAGDDEFGEGIVNYGRLGNPPDTWDVAVSGHTLAPKQTTEDVTVVVAAENRGTEPLAELALNVQLAGDSYRELFRDVDVGQTVSIELILPRTVLADGNVAQLTTTARIPGREDAKPLDNTMHSSIFLPQTESPAP